MTRRAQRLFPLIDDDKPVIELSRVMQLYDNADLITNIRGDYREKFYDDEDNAKPPLQNEPVSPPQPSFEPAEKARQEARADLKKKRQALVTREKLAPSKTSEVTAQKEVIASKTRWSDYAQKLRQETYILAELPQVYQEPQNPSMKAVQKNTYDFLKRSQIYNKEANQRQMERRVAQELNLSRFEDIN